MTNKSRSDFAYSLFDVDSKVDASVVGKLSEVEGVIRVRIVK
jgi:D-3-phosphoglycerate dehydrogenase